MAAGIGQGKDSQCISVYHHAADALASAKNNALKNDRIVAFGSFWVVTGVTENSGLNFPTNHH
jgi:dihydrofolate synthase/folylpolyglutamate synthase